MPAILDRCVEHVMEKGNSEASAYAICRVQLGLQTDGSEDERRVEMSEQELLRKVETYLQFPNGPLLRKKMVIASPIGEFVNGPDQKGKMTVARLRRLVENQRAHPRQIPIFFEPGGKHPPANDLLPPVGWIEGLEIDTTGNLVGDAKLHGIGAEVVGKDLVRLASIYTLPGRAYDGTPIGEILKHVLLSNESFIKDMNIAAATASGDERPLVFFTALKEAAMAEPDKEPTPASGEGTPTTPATDEIALKAENLRLREENETLQARLANASIDKDKEAALVENHNLRRKSFAQDVRALVQHGLNAAHTLRVAWCDGAMGKSVLDFEGTIKWLKASPKFGFDGSLPEQQGLEQALRNLRFVVENGPVQFTVGKSMSSGAPQGATVALSQEDKDLVKRVGSNPERIAAMTDETTYKEWLALKEQTEGAKA